MKSGRVLCAVLGAVGLAVAFGGAAQAQTARPKTFDFTVRSEQTVTPQGPARSVKLDTAKGRWGVTLNLDQPAGRDMNSNDVQAGAYFRITPSLRVGGAVALGDKEVPTYRSTQPQGQPRVRLETALNF